MKRRYDQWIGATPPETPWADSLLQGLGLASKVYRSGVRFRTWAYRRGVFRRFALGVPVVSVGNVTAGGTGKTPLVMHLAERLQADGARVVILSRGYIRQGKGVIVVSDGDRVLARKRRAGDEPYLMGIRLPKVPIIVGSNRLEAGMVAARRFDPDVVLVDDGFQHLRLHRDWDIVAVDAVNPFGNDRLLPRGTLREPAAHIRRAQLVCLTHTDMAPDLDDVVAQIDHLAPLCPIVQSRHVVSSVYRHP
ncbi:MAG: tetraacyldisaccharide 4'-kinase, partial [Candidatus Latescibacteria bacterium]|nr:tetraacyldisaccharide 4'-kinase [Candidatus Latescibacterota bacterium]